MAMAIPATALSAYSYSYGYPAYYGYARGPYYASDERPKGEAAERRAPPAAPPAGH
jgi:hypothetical protein